LGDEPLLHGLPDLVVRVRRDGIVLDHGGGLGLSHLRLGASCAGKRIEEVWPESVAQLLRRLINSAIAQRRSTEAMFQERGLRYDARVTAQGPDRAVCVIRPALSEARDDALDATGEQPRPHLDRRGFLKRFKDAMSMAALCEKPAAVAVIHLDGAADIAQIFDAKIAEQLMSVAIMRLPPQLDAANGETPQWFMGQLSDSLLALVLQTCAREALDACVSRVCASLREPLSLGDAAFHLTPYAGVAILGRDATSPKILLDHARAAATQARRSGSGTVCFFSDTVRLRSLARLDIARELRGAIANGDIRLRYAGRHDLASGRLVTAVGYVRWLHPIRGAVRPEEFLRTAETTGLATALSRAVLSCLQEDFIALAPQWNADVRISFGALRHHILDGEFAADILRLLETGALPAERLELRIAEKTFITPDAPILQHLQDCGVQLVVDEVGRGLGSLDRLARAPIWGLQLDRAWVSALQSDAIALRVCCAGIGLAKALGLTAIATGVDDPAQREALLRLGCQYGSGDLYRDAVPDITRPYRASAAR
jgi:EAL domain-containing protein (putative c-di-GMP-specific phosphodiesterase class I)/GGDEF domain-containing protein